MNSKVVERQIQQIKSLVKTQERLGKNNQHRSPNRQDFPIRFSAKPFVHYGYSARKAANKKKITKEMIKKNDNKMKLYIALLQKEKRSKKPTIESIKKNNSPHRIFLQEPKGSVDLDGDMTKINIATQPIEKSILTSLRPSQPHLEPLPSYDSPEKESKGPDSPSPSPNGKINESLLQQQSQLLETSVINKSIINKNSEHVPKHKIISSIRKFDDRCT